MEQETYPEREHQPWSSVAQPSEMTQWRCEMEATIEWLPPPLATYAHNRYNSVNQSGDCELSKRNFSDEEQFHSNGRIQAHRVK